MPLALSVDVLSQLWPHALPGMVAGVSADSPSLERYGIVTLPDLVDFLAECSEETGGMTRVVESGDYTAERAHQVWPSLFPTVASAEPFVTDERKLFNKTYGSRLGNRPGTDDGYNYRGRGMIQITGRGWYAKIGKEMGIDLLGNPDLAASPADILECAAAYWRLAGVSKLANAGDFVGEVRRINGGLVNMPARLQWRATAQKILTLDAVSAPRPAPAPAGAQQATTAAANVKGNAPMAASTPFSFASLIAMAEGAVTVLPQVVKVGETAYSDIKDLAADPAALAIEAWINSEFTHVSTPGAAAILEPKT